MASAIHFNDKNLPRGSITESKGGKELKGQPNAPIQEIPVLAKLPPNASPIPIRLRLGRDDDPSKGRRVVGKDVACVEEFLVEELPTSRRGREGQSR